MHDRKLLALAIIALDLIIKDCLERERQGKQFHEVALDLLKYTSSMLNGVTDLDHNHQQYIFNVSEISADIKRIFLNSAISDDDLMDMLELQKVRLKWLGTDTESEEIRSAHGLN